MEEERGQNQMSRAQVIYSDLTDSDQKNHVCTLLTPYFRICYRYTQCCIDLYCRHFKKWY